MGSRDGPVRWGMPCGLSTRKFMILASRVNAADCFFVKIPPHLEVFRLLLGNGGVHSNSSFSHITRTYHEPTIPVSCISDSESLRYNELRFFFYCFRPGFIQSLSSPTVFIGSGWKFLTTWLNVLSTVARGPIFDFRKN